MTSVHPDSTGRRAVKRWTRSECTWCISQATHRLFIGAGNGVAWGCDRHSWQWLQGAEM